ncbi:BPSL1445 family SYLF domain-containing lipoprotein [Neisseria sp. Ec49-e6-T10]|uniref:BPSL1445 family SYLF domain-containing lipoprotein n=1 Tax=Neisseria sp. Ec49-e6-T10 TaxID=3140744 RepID=UPI003EBB8316
MITIEREIMMIKTLMAMMLSFMILGCTTTSTDSLKNNMSERQKINSQVNETLVQLYKEAKGSEQMALQAKGILIFPSVYTAALVVGGEYGKGALRIGNKNAGYYQTVTGSLGVQAGAQSKAIILFFMTKESLTDFQKSNGWTAGAHANIALFKVGADGTIDTDTAKASIVGFVLTNGGLMFNASLNGTKVSKLDI